MLKWSNLIQGIKNGIFPSSNPDFHELLMAVRRDSPEEVAAKLPSVNLASTDSAGNTAVVIAATIGRNRALNALLNFSKANINDHHEQNGCTPLMLCVIAGNSEGAKILLEAGANPNAQNRELMTALMWAILEGSTPAALELIAWPNTNINLQQNSGDTALHLACYESNYHIVTALLSANADVNIRNQLGVTALMQCVTIPRRMASDDRSRISTALIRSGRCNPELRNELGQTALVCAGQYGHREVVEQLLSINASVTTVDKKGRTALHYAAMSGNLELLQLLIEARASYAIADATGLTPIIAASRNGQSACVKRLMDLGADAEAKSHTGDTCLMYCASSGMLLGVQALLDRKVEVNTQNNLGNTALMLAVNGNHFESVQLLLRSGADPTLANHSNHTPLASAAYLGHTNIVAELLSLPNCLQMVDLPHADIGLAPLGLAATKGHVEVCRILLEKGNASVNFASPTNGDTALMIACENGFQELVHLLLKYKADVNAVNHAGLSAYQLARVGGHKLVQSTLKINGASKALPDKECIIS